MTSLREAYRRGRRTGRAAPARLKAGGWWRPPEGETERLVWWWRRHAVVYGVMAGILLASLVVSVTILIDHPHSRTVVAVCPSLANRTGRCVVIQP